MGRPAGAKNKTKNDAEILTPQAAMREQQAVAHQAKKLKPGVVERYYERDARKLRVVYITEDGSKQRSFLGLLTAEKTKKFMDKLKKEGEEIRYA